MRQITRSSKTAPKPAASKKTAIRPSTDGGILLDATELFAGRDRHDTENKHIFLELAENLLPATSLKDRRRIANLLAAHPEMPDHLLEKLASDEDELTAYSALRYSPRLSVDLLLKISKTGSDTLRKAIANRPSLRESVLTALCQNAGASVIRILLDRDDIILLAANQACLSSRSDIVASLGLELAGQDALNPDGLMSQYLHLPASLRAKAIASAEVTSLIKQAQTPPLARSAGVNASRLKLIDGLRKEALAGNTSAFADLLGQGLGLPQATCDLLLKEDQGDGLIVALKALNLTPPDMTTILVRLLGEKLTLTKIRSLLRLQRTLSSGAADVLIEQWMLRDQGEERSGELQTPHYQESQRARKTAGKKRVVARVSAALRKKGSKAE